MLFVITVFSYTRFIFLFFNKISSVFFHNVHGFILELEGIKKKKKISDLNFTNVSVSPSLSKSVVKKKQSYNGLL